MRASTLLSFSLLSIALPFGALASSHGSAKARAHHEIAMRNSGNATTTVLNKRETFSNARFTFYDVTEDTTSCEDNPQPSDYVVALNVHQYGTYWYSKYCHKQVTISFGGKTAVAKIVDECMGCPYGGLDFSEGLFAHFSDMDAGVIYGSWYFTEDGGDGGDDGGDDDTTTTKKHTSTTTHHTTTKTTTKEKPTSTYTPHTTTKEKTTSTSTKEKTSSTESSTTVATSTKASTTTTVSSTAAETSVNYSSGPASGLAVPTGGTGSGDSSTIGDLTQAIINIGGLAAAAAKL